LTYHRGQKPSFEEFVSGYALRISRGEIWQDFRNGFVRRMIDRYRQAFGGNLLIYHHRVFRENPLAVINSIERFISVPRYFSEENFRNEIVNAGTRRNIGFAAYLLSRGRFVDAVGRFLPRRLIQTARNAYVALGTSKNTPPAPSFTAEQIALASDIFSDDDSWIESLFADAPIQLGSRDVFEVGEASRNGGSSRE